MILRLDISEDKNFWKWPTLFWLTFFTCLFTIYGLLSTGVYSDDELTHALHLRTIWDDPIILLNYFVRPGFKLLYLFQSSGGPIALLITNALFSSFTCIFCTRIAARMNVPYPELAGIICACVPIFYVLSFRMYGEVPATMFLVIAIDCFLGKRLISAAIIISACFLIRQEMAMYALVMGGWFLYKGNWKGVFALAWAPLVLNLAGWIVHGDPLWVWSQYFSVFVNDIPTKATASLFLALGYIFSSVIIFCAGIGIIFGQTRLKIPAFPFRLLIVLLLMHYASQYFMASGWISNPSPGWWRFLNPMAPLLSIFGAMGIIIIIRESWWREWKFLLSFALLLAFIGIFLSFKHDHYNIWTDGWREAPLNSVFILLGIVIFLRLVKVQERLSILCIAIFFLLNNIFTNPPFKPTFEEKVMVEVSDWVEKNRDRSLPVYCNHVYYYYDAGIKYNYKNPMTPGIYPKTIQSAPPGSIIIWESHYGSIPSKPMGIPEGELENYNLQEVKRYCGEGECKSGFYVRILKKY